MSDPERRAASTTTTPRDKPEMILFASREIRSARLEARRHLADEAAALADGAVEIRILGRVDHV
jgi:hypothetical protein